MKTPELFRAGEGHRVSLPCETMRGRIRADARAEATVQRYVAVRAPHDLYYNYPFCTQRHYRFFLSIYSGGFFHYVPTCSNYGQQANAIFKKMRKGEKINLELKY